MSASVAIGSSVSVSTTFLCTGLVCCTLHVHIRACGTYGLKMCGLITWQKRAMPRTLREAAESGTRLHSESVGHRAQERWHVNGSHTPHMCRQYTYKRPDVSCSSEKRFRMFNLYIKTPSKTSDLFYNSQFAHIVFPAHNSRHLYMHKHILAYYQHPYSRSNSYRNSYKELKQYYIRLFTPWGAVKCQNIRRRTGVS